MATPNVEIHYCKTLTILPIKVPYLLTFKLGGTYQYVGGTDHTVKLSSSNKNIATLTTKQVVIEKAWKFLTNIEGLKVGSARITIDVDGTTKQRLDFKFLNNKDVFQKAEHTKIIEELDYIEEFADDHHPSEYSGNYCMQAAERGLSELLVDTKNFYSVHRDTHKQKNNIGFSGKTAYDRGNLFVKRGFVESTHVFNHSDFTIDHKQKDQIYNSASEDKANENYKDLKYTIIGLTATKKAKLEGFFTADLKGKEIGYHVYYFTVTDGFHTLILIINTFDDPCNPTYQIWDQHGLSSSKGKLTDIADGIRRQTSWTFANTCLNRYKSGKTSQWNSTKAKFWKIKSK